MLGEWSCGIMHLSVILRFQFIIMHNIRFVLEVRNKRIFTWIHYYYYYYYYYYSLTRKGAVDSW